VVMVCIRLHFVGVSWVSDMMFLSLVDFFYSIDGLFGAGSVSQKTFIQLASLLIRLYSSTPHIINYIAKIIV